MKISVITPTFNSAKTLSQTLDSLMKQDLLPFEHIIIDGLSKDGTNEMLQEYKRNAPYTVTIVSEKDDGIYDAMNKGIKLAQGDIIGIVNSDDWYEVSALRTVFESCSILGSGVYYGFQRYILDEKEFYIERTNVDFIGIKMIQHPTCFVTKDVYEKFGAFDLKYRFSADLEMILRFKQKEVPFIPLDAIISNFRIGGASSTIIAAHETLDLKLKFGYLTKKQYLFKIMKLKTLQLFKK